MRRGAFVAKSWISIDERAEPYAVGRFWSEAYVRKYLVGFIFIVAVSAALFAWIRYRGVEPPPSSSVDIIPQNAVTADTKLELNEQDLSQNLARARQGDAVAARLLSYHFGALRNEPERVKWLIAAGKAGDCTSVLNLQHEKALPATEVAAWTERAKTLKCDPQKEFGITVNN